MRILNPMHLNDILTGMEGFNDLNHQKDGRRKGQGFRTKQGDFQPYGKRDFIISTRSRIDGRRISTNKACEPSPREDCYRIGREILFQRNEDCDKEGM